MANAKQEFHYKRQKAVLCSLQWYHPIKMAFLNNPKISTFLEPAF